MTAYKFGDSNIHPTDLTIGRIKHRSIDQPTSPLSKRKVVYGSNTVQLQIADHIRFTSQMWMNVIQESTFVNTSATIHMGHMAAHVFMATDKGPTCEPVKVGYAMQLLP